MKVPVKKAKTPKRVRRSADDARALILEAAERRLLAVGPAGIRLQDIADDVGVSHPTILHHFGSRERLVHAVAMRHAETIKQEVVGALAGGAPDEASFVPLFERLYEMFGPGGHARVMAYFALEGRPAGAQAEALKPIADATHAVRLARLGGEGSAPDYEDTYFAVLLASFALFGEAIAGPLFRGQPDGQRDEAVSKRFRAWTARRMVELLERGTEPAPVRRRKR